MRRLEESEGIALATFFVLGGGRGVALGDRPTRSPFLLMGTIVDTPLVSLPTDADERARGLVALVVEPAVDLRE